MKNKKKNDEAYTTTNKSTSIRTNINVSWIYLLALRRNNHEQPQPNHVVSLYNFFLHEILFALPSFFSSIFCAISRLSSTYTYTIQVMLLWLWFIQCRCHHYNWWEWSHRNEILRLILRVVFICLIQAKRRTKWKKLPWTNN